MTNEIIVGPGAVTTSNTPVSGYNEFEVIGRLKNDSQSPSYTLLNGHFLANPAEEGIFDAPIGSDIAGIGTFSFNAILNVTGGAYFNNTALFPMSHILGLKFDSVVTSFNGKDFWISAGHFEFYNQSSVVPEPSTMLLKVLLS